MTRMELDQMLREAFPEAHGYRIDLSDTRIHAALGIVVRVVISDALNHHRRWVYKLEGSDPTYLRKRLAALILEDAPRFPALSHMSQRVLHSLDALRVIPPEFILDTGSDYPECTARMCFLLWDWRPA